MQIYNFEQGTEEWLNIRLGKFTGSNFHIFLNDSSKKENELWIKASEIITNTRTDTKKFSNIHINRGHELEADAKTMYELLNDCKVVEVGFIELNERVGCSPDGLVGTDGIIEIKCKDNHTFMKQCVGKIIKIEPIYKTQIQFNLYVSDRKWCDYICYNPNFKSSLFVLRINRDEKKIQEIKDCLIECTGEVDEIIKNFKKVQGE